jgi:hypothetical protein
VAATPARAAGPAGALDNRSAAIQVNVGACSSGTTCDRQRKDAPADSHQWSDRVSTEVGGVINARATSQIQLEEVFAADGDVTSIGVTNRTGDYNRRTEAHDWKRRSERLVRASGRPYTIVRPGWFDYNAPNEHRLVLLQGDRRQAGDPSDGVVARRQIAQVLVRSLTSPEADRKTFELLAAAGAAQPDLGPLFAALDADPPGSLDAVHDPANMPLAEEPQRVRDDLDAHASREP